MSSRIAQVIVLAEDLRSARFLRKYLERAVHPREIQLRITRRGAGEQFVRESYAAEVREQRRRVHGRNRNAALAVHLDADADSVEQRHRQLAGALELDAQAPRDSHELIAIIVPKRNTETWLHGLCGARPVDEEYDYKEDRDRTVDDRDWDTKLVPAAVSLYELTRPNAANPPESLPALQRAVSELRRLE